MAEDRGIYIIGGPGNAAINYSAAIPGTRILDCEQCKAPTAFAPSSLNRPEAREAKFICMRCAAKLEGDPVIGAPTPEQIREMHSAGVDALVMYTVYKNASDYPGRHVVRRASITPLGVAMDPEPLFVGDSLSAAREAIQAQRPGLIRMMPSPEDDPVIVETWM